MRTLWLLGRAWLLAAVVLLAGTAAAAAASPWQAPLRPMTVTRSFVAPPTPYAAGHRGVDLAGRVGETVLATADGVVSYAGSLAGRGVVVIVHGTLRTTYEPVEATVHRGEAVTKGHAIGLLQAGHHDCPAPACLHWGLLRGRTYLDPLHLLGAQRVRLLPPSGALTARPAAPAIRAGPVSVGAAAPPALSPGVTWSVAAVAGAGVVMIRRRR